MHAPFEVDGIAVYLNPAPPVYAPGGPVGFAPELPDKVTSQSVASLETEAARRGAVVMVVQCPASALEHQELLEARGYTFASSWYLGPPAMREGVSDSSMTIRPATAGDVPGVLEIREKKFDQYESFSPVFWKKAPIPREQFAPFITGQLESESNVALVAEQGGVMRGFIVAQCRNLSQGFVDDYAVADHTRDWRDAGIALLAEAGKRAQLRSVNALVIVTGHADVFKRNAVESLGYVLQTNWMVKSL